jgi:hypothetical protein
MCKINGVKYKNHGEVIKYFITKHMNDHDFTEKDVSIIVNSIYGWWGIEVKPELVKLTMEGMNIVAATEAS